MAKTNTISPRFTYIENFHDKNNDATDANLPVCHCGTILDRRPYHRFSREQCDKQLITGQELSSTLRLSAGVYMIVRLSFLLPANNRYLITGIAIHGTSTLTFY